MPKLIWIFLSVSSIYSYSQCAMCKAVVENGNSDMAEGLNKGIVILMVIPYILVGIIALILWKYRHKWMNRT